MSDKEDLDLFGSDPEEEKEAEERAAKLKAEAEKKEKEAKEKAKKKKKVYIAKSIVVFDVKVYEQDEDFEKLAKEIKEGIKMEGLVWNVDHKILPVGFGMNKLQLTMVIEDDRVSADDVLEQIQEKWEDNVQSTDIDSFNKL